MLSLKNFARLILTLLICNTATLSCNAKDKQKNSEPGYSVEGVGGAKAAVAEKQKKDYYTESAVVVKKDTLKTKSPNFFGAIKSFFSKKTNSVNVMRVQNDGQETLGKSQESDFIDTNNIKYTTIGGKFYFYQGIAGSNSGRYANYYIAYNAAYQAYESLLPIASSSGVIAWLSHVNARPAKDIVYLYNGLTSNSRFHTGDAGAFYGLSYFNINSSDLLLEVGNGNYLLTISDISSNEVLSVNASNIACDNVSRFIVTKYDDKEGFRMVNGHLYKVIVSKSNHNTLTLYSNNLMPDRNVNVEKTFNVKFALMRDLESMRDQSDVKILNTWNSYIVLGNKKTRGTTNLNYSLFKTAATVFQLEERNFCNDDTKKLAHAVGISRGRRFDISEFQRSIISAAANMGHLHAMSLIYKNKNWQVIDPNFVTDGSVDLRKQTLFFIMNNINTPALIRAKNELGQYSYWNVYDSDENILDGNNTYHIDMSGLMKTTKWTLTAYELDSRSLSRDCGNKYQINYSIMPNAPEGNDANVSIVKLKPKCSKLETLCLQIPKDKNFYIKIDALNHGDRAEVDGLKIKKIA